MSRMEKQIKKKIKWQMAYISDDKSWRSEFYKVVSVEDRVQHKNLNQMKLDLNETYRRNGKIATKFKRSQDEKVINKTYLDENFTKLEGHLSIVEKSFRFFKLNNNKQSVEEILIQRSVKMTFQLIYDKGLFDK